MNDLLNPLAFHLPVTPELVGVCLANPELTFDDCDALYFSIGNRHGYNHSLIPYILAAQGRLVRRTE